VETIVTIVLFVPIE